MKMFLNRIFEKIIDLGVDVLKHFNNSHIAVNSLSRSVTRRNS